MIWTVQSNQKLHFTNLNDGAVNMNDADSKKENMVCLCGASHDSVVSVVSVETKENDGLLTELVLSYRSELSQPLISTRLVSQGRAGVLLCALLR